MRHSPLVVSGIFIGLTLYRVGTFSVERMHTGGLGWLFSVAIGAAVFVSAYYTRVAAARADVEISTSRATRKLAFGALVFFAAVDGIFNSAESFIVVAPEGIGMQIVTILYGITPTIGAAILGALQGRIDRTPRAPAKYSIATGARRLASAWIAGKARRLELDAPPEQPEANESKVEANEKHREASESTPAGFACAFPGCGYVASSTKALSGHQIKHRGKNGKHAESTAEQPRANER